MAFGTGLKTSALAALASFQVAACARPPAYPQPQNMEISCDLANDGGHRKISNAGYAWLQASQNRLSVTPSVLATGVAGRNEALESCSFSAPKKVNVQCNAGGENGALIFSKDVSGFSVRKGGFDLDKVLDVPAQGAWSAEDGSVIGIPMPKGAVCKINQL